MSAKDPKGYYATLGLPHTASGDDIKAAYRRKAMDLHPDRNKAANTTEQFQRLSAAYAVLGDSAARAQYDTDSIQNQHDQSTSSKPQERIVCSCCGKITAQPRYVIFFEVKSFIFTTTRTTSQGIFCSVCAEKKALRATLTTWLFGWWSLSGFFYSIHAIAINLFGGKQSPNVNARLAAHQAWVIATLGNAKMARAIAIDALELAKKVKPDKHAARLKKKLGYEMIDEGVQLRQQIESLIDRLGDGRTAAHLKNPWALLRRPFYIQSTVALAVVLLCWFAILSDWSDSPQPGPKPYTPDTAATPYPAPRRTYVRPANSPNGEPWPTLDGYLSTYPRIHENGFSTVTVDNSQSDSDVFVQLVSLDGENTLPVRTFFIHAHGSFTLRHITPGNYSIRYRDLVSGHLSRSDTFKLVEISSNGRTQYSNAKISLHKVRSGNLKMYELPETAF
jgi:hypothetical protein